MALLDILRSAVENARSIPGLIGIRPFSVYLVQKVEPYPSHGDPIQGLTITTYRTKLGVKDSTGTVQNPFVEETQCRELLASGGFYSYTRLDIGPLTKNFIINTVPGGYITTGINPLPLPRFSGTATITKVSNTCTIPITSSAGLLVGQGITISNAAHTANNGIFLITAIGTNTVSWTNTIAVAESVNYSVSGNQEMHIEVVNSDDSTTDKYSIAQIHEFDLLSLYLQCSKITGDVG